MQGDLEADSKAKRDFFGVSSRSPSPDKAGNNSRGNTPKAKTPKLTDSSDFNAKETFVAGISQVRRKNVAAKLYLTGQDESFDKEKMLLWLKDKVDVSKWGETKLNIVYDNMLSKTLEIAATSPPTIIMHAMSVRFIHKKKVRRGVTIPCYSFAVPHAFNTTSFPTRFALRSSTPCSTAPTTSSREPRLGAIS